MGIIDTMIQCQLKLRLTKVQESTLNEWLFILTGVWNWAIRKIELDACDGILYSEKQFQNLLANHSSRIGIPSHTVQGVISTAHRAWVSYCKKLTGKPSLKGNRRKLNSIPFPDPVERPSGSRAKLPFIGSIKFNKQHIPNGPIKLRRLIRRSSGWYLCLFIDTEREAIKRIANGRIGIDPGFKDLLVTSDYQRIGHPNEFSGLESRIAQAHRGRKYRLAGRLNWKVKNRRKDRNHKIALKLVQQNEFIAFSKDPIKGLAKNYGKNVASNAHYQLRRMIEYKSRAGGTRYVEVVSRNSTKTCSACRALSGPTGFAGLKVRQWVCTGCGASHDRDVNAAINTLIAGAGAAHEDYAKAA